MERRTGQRVQVDWPVTQHVDGFAHECRAVDLSSNGIVVEQPSRLAWRPRRFFYRMDVPTDAGRLAVIGRTVWSDGPLVAMRLVQMNASDERELAALLDRLGRSGFVH